MNEKEIRATYNEKTITVYQAYNQTIAVSVLKAQRFASPYFKESRMTWIKPSFLWMMYRSGWATKENQEYILSIEITREGFEWALQNSCLSHFDPTIHNSMESWKDKLSKSPVRVQWDPERDLHMSPLNYRSIQIGLSGPAVEKYLHEWIVEIEDITERCKEIKHLINIKEIRKANDMLPKEKTYHLPISIQVQLGITV